ncbi:MAG: primosomal protein N' [Candidatus Tectimicrobiota bacterium]|nr:MAG: primosomal protein N' [Candidatus Tectomicrobia bacterium]
MGALPAIAQVAVELPIPTPLDYRIPPPLRAVCRLGQRVLVPVGRRHVLGYVVGLASASAAAEVKELAEILDEAPLLTPELLALTRWVAEYYLCPWGQVLKAAVPRAFRVRTQPVYALASPDSGEAAGLAPDAAQVLSCLRREGALSRQELGRRVGPARIAGLLRRLEEQGLIVQTYRRLAPPARPRLVSKVRLQLSVAEARALQHTLQQRAPAQAAVLACLLKQPEWELATLRAQVPGAAAAVRRLVQRGVVQVVESEQWRRVVPESPALAAADLQLTAAQQAALAHIEAKLAASDSIPVLLHGVTGSGKTEVYLRAIAAVLARGKTALVLVPEISLTDQLVRRLAARFAPAIAVLHSGLSTSERFDEWRRLAQGEARVAVGARSAVFAPLRHLGLIVVDEEHDTAYKQEEMPRYHARDVAIVRARQSGAVVVLGSATPALETYHNARRGKYLLLELPQRIDAKPLPHVTLVDQRAYAAAPERVITPPLAEAIAACLQRQEQCLILVNRRGFAAYLQCRDCGLVPQCVRCSVSLTYHRADRRLKCHYCDWQQPAPQRCRGCEGTRLQPHGLGTQQVEEALRAMFPTARLRRMDRDTTRGKAAPQQILQALARGEVDILVGTQMIAKGHDYPRITLVGVVAADATLALPDFRAAERLFQLLTQVAGRAGRGAAPGEVFIQTYRPEHYSIRYAQHHDFAGFFAQEAANRQTMGYPPFVRLARVVLDGLDAKRVEEASQWLGGVWQALARRFPGLHLLGPAEAPIGRLQRRYRWHMLVKAATSRMLHRFLAAALQRVGEDHQPLRGVRLSLDVDPQSFL